MKYTWLVEKYLEGELNGEALRKFELEILRKPEVAEEVERVRSMNHFMKEQHSKFQDSIGLIEDYEDSENVIDEEIIRRELEGLKVRRISNGQKNANDLRTKLTESKINHTLVEKRSNKVLVRKVSVWLAAASVAILMVTSISLVTRDSSRDHMAAYALFYSPQIADIQQRDISTGTDDAYDLALRQYNEGNYAEAYQMLENIPGEFISDHLYLYKGIAAMELGDFQMALRSFSKLQDEPVLNHYSMWYSGLSHIALDDIPAARKVLKEIIATDGHYKEQAIKLLKII